MDESRKPDNSASADYPWQNDETPKDALGATDVFGTSPDLGANPTPSPLKRDGLDGDAGTNPSKGSPQTPASVHGSSERALEPIVHKVVLGGSVAAVPVDLLELLRASAPASERAPAPGSTRQQSVAVTSVFSAVPASPPAPPPAQSNAGVTQLLRALSGEPFPIGSADQPGVVKGGAVQASEASYGSRVVAPQPGINPSPQTSNPDDGGFPPANGTGGFTALLQGMSESDPNVVDRKSSPLPAHERPSNPVQSAPITDNPLPAPAPAPGTFTQLFSALTADPTKPAATGLPSTIRPVADQRSFTQLISTMGQPSEPSPHEGEPALDGLLRGQSPAGRGTIEEQKIQPGAIDWSQKPAYRPEPESGPENGGLTQLIRTLVRPPNASASMGEPVSRTDTTGHAPVGTFTGLHRSLDEPGLHPSNPSASSGPDTEVHGVSSIPNRQAGPSEVTRIFDASKLREMQRPGTSVLPLSNPVAPVQPWLSPAAPNVQWPPQTPSPPPAWQPAQPSSMMQPPQYAQPAAIPQMSTPTPVTAPAAPPALGKLQQYLPLMLIVIIFLLVVILVTMVFMLKH